MFYNGIKLCKMSKPCVIMCSCVHLRQDVADFEWMMWFSTFRNHILFALVGHVIFAKIFTLIAPKVRACVCCSDRKRSCECPRHRTCLMVPLFHCMSLWTGHSCHTHRLNLFIAEPRCVIFHLCTEWPNLTWCMSMSCWWHCFYPVNILTYLKQFVMF